MWEGFVTPMRATKEWRPEPQFRQFLDTLVNPKDWNAFRSVFGLRVVAPGKENWDEIVRNFVNQYKNSAQYQAFIKDAANIAARDSIKPRLAEAKKVQDEKTAAYITVYKNNATLEMADKKADDELATISKSDSNRITQLNASKNRIKKALDESLPEEERLLSEKQKADWAVFLLQMMSTPKYWELTDKDPAFITWLNSGKPSTPVFDASTELIYSQIAAEYYGEYKGDTGLRNRMKSGVFELGMNKIFPNWRKWTGARQHAWEDTVKGVFDNEKILWSIDAVADFVNAVKDDPAWVQQIETTRWDLVKAKKSKRRRAFYSVVIIVAVIVVIVITAGALSSAASTAAPSTMLETITSYITSPTTLVSDLISGATGLSPTLTSTLVSSASAMVAAGKTKDQAVNEVSTIAAESLINESKKEQEQIKQQSKTKISPVVIGAIALGGLTIAGLVGWAIVRQRRM